MQFKSQVHLTLQYMYLFEAAQHESTQKFTFRKIGALFRKCKARGPTEFCDNKKVGGAGAIKRIDPIK